MNWYVLINSILLITLAWGLLIVIASSFGALVYDIRQAKKAHRLSLHPYSRQFRSRPLVSVVVVASNNEQSIRQCIESITTNKYRNTEIIVIDGGSIDGTKLITKNCITENSKKHIRLIAKRAPAHQNNVFIDSWDYKHIHGELVLVIEASSYLDRLTIKNMVQQFNASPSASVLVAHTQVLFNTSILALFQRFENLSMNYFKKTTSIANAEYRLRTSDTMYKKLTFTRLVRMSKVVKSNNVALNLPVFEMGNKENQIIYADNAHIYKHPITSISQFILAKYRLQCDRMQMIWSQRRLLFSRNPFFTTALTWVRLPLVVLTGFILLLMPLTVGYTIYLGLYLQKAGPFILIWLLIATILFLAIINTASHSKVEKFKLILLIPALFVCIAGAIFIKPIMIILGVFSFKKSQMHVLSGGTWGAVEPLIAEQ